MKSIISIIVSAVMSLVATASVTDIRATLDSVEVDYNNRMYNNALDTLLTIEREGTSSQLCYNIGANYYRLNNIPLAVTCFERALMLDPSNNDAKDALKITRERASLTDDAFASDHYVIASFKRLMFSHSGDTYAVWAVVTFFLILVGIAVYFVSENVVMRKVGFFAALVSLIMCVLLNVMAAQVHDVTSRHRFAVITATGTRLNAVPREVTDSSQVVLSLKPGTRVLLVDSVDADTVRWYAIEHPRATVSRAWLPATAVQRP